MGLLLSKSHFLRFPVEPESNGPCCCSRLWSCWLKRQRNLFYLAVCQGSRDGFCTKQVNINNQLVQGGWIPTRCRMVQLGGGWWLAISLMYVTKWMNCVLFIWGFFWWWTSKRQELSTSTMLELLQLMANENPFHEISHILFQWKQWFSIACEPKRDSRCIKNAYWSQDQFQVLKKDRSVISFSSLKSTINILQPCLIIIHKFLSGFRISWWTFTLSLPWLVLVNLGEPGQIFLRFPTWCTGPKKQSTKPKQFHLHAQKLTCPLKRNYFNRKYIFQPSIFRWHVRFSERISSYFTPLDNLRWTRSSLSFRSMRRDAGKGHCIDYQSYLTKLLSVAPFEPQARVARKVNMKMEMHLTNQTKQ